MFRASLANHQAVHSCIKPSLILFIISNMRPVIGSACRIWVCSVCPLRPAGCSNYCPHRCKSYIDGRPTIPYSLLEIIIIRSNDCFIQLRTLGWLATETGNMQEFMYIEPLLLLWRRSCVLLLDTNSFIIMHWMENIKYPLIASLRFFRAFSSVVR